MRHQDYRHELRALLGTISDASRALQRSGETAGPVCDRETGRIDEAVNRIERLIQETAEGICRFRWSKEAMYVDLQGPYMLVADYMMGGDRLGGVPQPEIVSAPPGEAPKLLYPQIQGERSRKQAAAFAEAARARKFGGPGDAELIGGVDVAPEWPRSPQAAAEVRCRSEFAEEVADAINRHSLEELSGDTPDHIVAQHLAECLIAFGNAVRTRDLHVLTAYRETKGE